MSALLAVLLAAPAAALSAEALRHGASAAFDGTAPRGAAVAAPRPAPEPPLALSDLARAFAADPKAADELLDFLVAQAGELGTSLDSPERRAFIKEAIRSADPAALDRFPTVAPAALAQAGDLYAARQGPNPPVVRPPSLALALAGAPADPPVDHALRPLGRGLLHGDESLRGGAAKWGDSLAVAAALDQLAADGGGAFLLDDGGRTYGSVLGWLAALLAEGHAIEVRSRRMYANFGDLLYEQGGRRRAVATPTWLDTGVVLPSGRRLVVPVAHSQLDVEIRGPRVNADLAWWYGLDGVAAFRVLDTKDQGWAGGRTVRTWRGLDAARILDRAALVSRGLAEKAAAGALPRGGYGPLGGCNDALAFVTGETPLGSLRDRRRFSGSHPLDALSAALPYDRHDPIDPVRVWESRPFEDPRDIPLPELRAAMLELKAHLGR